jgi:hypothetical protein
MMASTDEEFGLLLLRVRNAYATLPKAARPQSEALIVVLEGWIRTLRLLERTLRLQTEVEAEDAREEFAEFMDVMRQAVAQLERAVAETLEGDDDD